ncbi:ABC transporter [Colletotrichum navitas]|uniref:ABC transporter n=1 Tax=Colletotrichum navitas TaxID=681940 RepID=A0AAD8QBV3_9PEZI|nr:ABC transporter [Colletotrichum navitas]KAK1598438.1 ABC transporter [Colletotrichum navitas]
MTGATQALVGVHGWWWWCPEVPPPGPTHCARTAAGLDFGGLGDIAFSVVPCSVAILWALHRCARRWKQPVVAAAVAQGSILPARFLIGCAVLSVLLCLTLPFQLSVVPAAAVLASGLIVSFRRLDRPVSSPQGSHLLTHKMILWHALVAYQFAGLISSIGIAVVGGDRYPDMSVNIATWALSFGASLVLLSVSALEHGRSLAPSALLQTFLLVAVVLDAARVGGAWIDGVAIFDEGRLFAIRLLVEVALLFAESSAKAAVVAIPARRASREEVAGIFGKGLALWVNPLLALGWRKDLTVDDFEPLDEPLSGDKVLGRLSSAWQKVNQGRNHALGIAVLRTFWAEILAIQIPRLIMVGLGLSQPLLVQTTLTYIQNHEDKPASYGRWLIAAFALNYVGLAIATQQYEQLTNRLITRVRGALIAIIYQNMLSLRAETGNAQAAVSLMSTEVDRITVAGQWTLSIVPSLLHLGFAFWILGGQLGGVSVAPVVVAASCVFLGLRVGQRVPPLQRKWMQAIQKRVGITTEIVGSMKGVKMSGLSAMAQDQIQGLRDFELDESKKFRRMQILNVTVGKFPSIMTPPITFAAFAIVQKLSGGEPLNVVQAFTSLSLLGMLINPVGELVTLPNNLGSVIGCLDRIQEFLAKEKRDDYRRFTPQTPRDPAPHGDGASEPPAADPRLLIKVAGGSFGWDSATPVLHAVDLEVPTSTLTMLIGPVGSGKSTLLKSVVGETYRFAGSVEYFTTAAGADADADTGVAYCDQDAWILNQSIKDNIFGGAEYDPVLYSRVIQACQLDEDLSLLPRGDETLVGSSGAALSGGQKQRIALARAVYSGKKVIIMDDNLKGLDSNTASGCFDALFGADGLLRERNQAVLFATHNAQLLPFADTIIALGSDGRVSERGSYEELSKSGGYVSTLQVSQQEGGRQAEENGAGEVGDKPVSSSAAAAAAAPDASKTPNARGAANTSALAYYIKSMGVSSFALFFVMVLLQTSCSTMQRVWVKYWVAANEAGGEENLALWAGMYVGWGVLTEAAVAAEIFWFLVVIIPHSAKGLHLRILKAAFAAPLSFFVKTDTGVIINRFSQDMNLIDVPLPIAFLLTSDTLTMTIADIILTCAATAYLALAVPVLAAVLWAIQHVYLRTSRQVRLLDLEAKAPIFSHFVASFSGLVTVRALGWAGRAGDENLARLDRSQRAFYAMGSLQKWLLLALNLTVAGLAVLLVATAVALRDVVDSGLLGVALVSVTGFGQLLTGLLGNWAMLDTSLGAVARIREFERETPSEEKDEQTLGAFGEWPPKGQIDMINVSAAYDDHRVLSGIDLSIKPGEKVAVCGRTGSGKSTLLALLLRLHEPSTGAIEMDGVDIASVPVKQLRESLVALPQDPLFLPGTVRRNLDPFGARDDAAVWGALEKTGLESLFEDKGGLEADLNMDWLSAGQKQLFCIARAMLRDSRVLLLDEATSSLDQATERIVQDLIRSEFRRWTVVVIAHRLKTVADFDKIVTLQDGRVAEFDHPKALLEKGGLFASMWKLQEG